MTRLITRLLAGAALLCACSFPAAAQTGAGETEALVLRPLSLVNTAALDFGQLIAGSTAGIVVITPGGGVRTVSGGVTAAGGSPSEARFVANGLVNALMIISLPGPITLSNGAGGTMAVNNFTTDGSTVRLFPAGGIATVRVGARLNVGANQAPGHYTGTFDLTVIYL